MKYGARLAAARKVAHFTQAELAEKIHHACTQVNISKLERGNASGSQFTTLFARACGVSHIWLATGEGQMVPSTNTETVDGVAGPREKPLKPSKADSSDVMAQRIEELTQAVNRLSQDIALALSELKSPESYRRDQVKSSGTLDMPITLVNSSKDGTEVRQAPIDKKRANKT